jgi:PhnB protein
MKISPYIAFNGNCKEAVEFYEKVFNVKAEIMYYKDAPAENGYETTAANENLVMHAQFAIDNEIIMLCDVPPESPVKIGDNITVMLEFDSITATTTIFDALKVGGEISMELAETFWSKLFGSLTDKFGVNWNISAGCPE